MQNNGQGTIYNTPKMTGVSSASIFKLLNKPAKEPENKRKEILSAIKKLVCFLKQTPLNINHTKKSV